MVDGVRVHRMDVPLLPFDIPFTPATFRLVSDLLGREQVDVAHFAGGIVSPLAFIGAANAQADGHPDRHHHPLPVELRHPGLRPARQRLPLERLAGRALRR